MFGVYSYEVPIMQLACVMSEDPFLRVGATAYYICAVGGGVFFPFFFMKEVCTADT